MVKWERAPGMPLGISLRAPSQASSAGAGEAELFVDRVDYGVVCDHNLMLGAELELRAGDKIVEVNGESSNFAKMKATLDDVTVTELEVRVKRPVQPLVF